MNLENTLEDVKDVPAIMQCLHTNILLLLSYLKSSISLSIGKNNNNIQTIKMMGMLDFNMMESAPEDLLSILINQSQSMCNLTLSLNTLEYVINVF